MASMFIDRKTLALLKKKVNDKMESAVLDTSEDVLKLINEYDLACKFEEDDGGKFPTDQIDAMADLMVEVSE